LSKAWLSLGANMGNPEAQIEQAIALIGQQEGIKISNRSKTIITEPWGNLAQNYFHNLVLEIRTDLFPELLLSILLKIEDDIGRVRNEKWGARIIDIDIIAYEFIEVTTKNLTLPHPHAFERDFVLNPLREISPKMADWIIEQAKSKKSNIDNN